MHAEFTVFEKFLIHSSVSPKIRFTVWWPIFKILLIYWLLCSSMDKRSVAKDFFIQKSHIRAAHARHLRLWDPNIPTEDLEDRSQENSEWFPERLPKSNLRGHCSFIARCESHGQQVKTSAGFTTHVLTDEGI